MTILDWRNEQMKDNFRKYVSETCIEINTYSLLSGYVLEDNITIYKNKNVNHIEKTLDSIPLNTFDRQIVSTLENPRIEYLSLTGRFGINSECISLIEESSRKTANKLIKYLGANKRILVLGHGENIYIYHHVLLPICKISVIKCLLERHPELQFTAMEKLLRMFKYLLIEV